LNVFSQVGFMANTIPLPQWVVCAQYHHVGSFEVTV
jgi:hypothetical protein